LGRSPHKALQQGEKLASAEIRVSEAAVSSTLDEEPHLGPRIRPAAPEKKTYVPSAARPGW
jgi:hypothetical protein